MTAQKNLIWLAYASLFLLGLADNIRGPLFPEIIQEFSLSNSQGSLFFALASGTAIPAGYLGSLFLRRFGRMQSLRISILLMILGVLGISFMPSYVFILMAVILFGFSIGTMGVVQNVMVIEASPRQELQKWQSGLHSMYGLASLLAPLVVIALYRFRPDWRIAFYFAASIGLVLLLATFWVHDSGQNFLHSEAEASHTGISHFQQIYFSLMLACYVASEILVGTRLAQFSREYFHFDFSEAAKLTSLFFVMLFLGRVLFIFWRPKVSLKAQMLVSLSASTLCLFIGLTVHPVALAFSGLAMAPFYPMSMTVAGKLFPKDLHQVTSLAIAISGITIVIAQLIVGFLGDQLGLRTALFVGPLFSFIALAMISQYKKIFNRDIP